MMFDRIFKRETVRKQQNEIIDLKGRIAAIDCLYKKTLKENSQQRELIVALRDVNASQDERCIEMQRIFQQAIRRDIDDAFGVQP